MNARLSDVEAFLRFVDALGPWLTSVVIVGGWADRLYRIHPLAESLDYPPLMTRDADVAVTAGMTASGKSIHDCLVGAGFEEVVVGEFRPPVTRYQLGSEAGGFYVEFLTPRLGSGVKRNGSVDAATRVAGVSAQKLRYLDLLLVAPWKVSLDAAKGFPLSIPVDVQVPNAASYIAQKVLIHSRRRPDQCAKDLLYIHDTIEVFGRGLDEVRQEWVARVRPTLRDRVIRRVRAASQAMFGEVTDELRGAARQAVASGRQISPETLQEVCRAGLARIFG